MKKLTVSMLAMAFLLAPFGVAQAQDADVTALKDEVAKLQDLVMKLQHEVEMLKAKVAKLERSAGGVSAPVSAATPAPPSPASAAKAAGTYVMNKEKTKEAMKVAMEKQFEQMPEDQREMARQMLPMVLQQIDMLTVTADVNADGSFKASMGMGMQTMDYKGTWKLDGNKVVITVTEEMGMKKEPPETLTAVLEGDTLKLSPDPNQPMAFILEKKK